MAAPRMSCAAEADARGLTSSTTDTGTDAWLARLTGTPRSLLEQLLAPLFRSDGQARLLSTLLLTGDELSVTDLAKQAGLAYPTGHREVARLVDAGILSERRVGRTRLIRANDESPLVDPLREILTVATGPVVVLPRSLAASTGSSRRSSTAPSPRGCSAMPVRRPTTST